MQTMRSRLLSIANIKNLTSLLTKLLMCLVTRRLILTTVVNMTQNPCQHQAANQKRPRRQRRESGLQGASSWETRTRKMKCRHPRQRMARPRWRPREAAQIQLSLVPASPMCRRPLPM